MKRFGTTSVLGVAVLLAGVPGCSIGGADETLSPQSTSPTETLSPQSTPPTETLSPQSTSPTVVSVEGTFRVNGGPYPGMEQALSGTITFRGPVTEEVSAAKGMFTVGLPPGEYKVTGQPEGHFVGVTCPSMTVTVAAAQTEMFEVACDVR